MATIYAKTDTLLGTKNALILGSREAVFRPFNFGAWNEVRIGIYHSPTLLNNSNTAPVNENVAITSYLDWLAFGLIDQNALLPGQAGANFIGAGTAGNGATGSGYAGLYSNTYWQLGVQNGGYMNYFSAINGAHVSIAMGTGTYADLVSSATPANPAGYAGFAGLKFVVANAGLSTQTIAVNYTTTAAVSVALTLPNLRSALTTFSPPCDPTNQVFQWNSGGAALSLPAYFYLRCPLNNNQLRIHAYDAIKIS